MLLSGASGKDRVPPTPAVGALSWVFSHMSYLQDIVFLRIIFVFGRLDLPFAKNLGLLQNKFNPHSTFYFV